MILKNKENSGGDSMVLQIEGITTVISPQQRIKVPKEYQYSTKKFEKLTRLAS